MKTQQENTKKLFHYSAMEKRKFLFVYLLILLPVVQIAIFFFYSNASAIMLAFKDDKGNWSFASILRVVEAFKTGKDYLNFNVLELLGKSVIIWTIQHIVGFVISILTSYILTKHMIMSKGFRLVYYIPSIVGGVVFSVVMKEMYSYDGIVLKILKELDVELEPLVIKNGLLGHVSTAFPTMMIQTLILSMAGGNMIMAGAYMRIPEEIFESAQLEGCGFFRETFQIAVPCAWPTLSTMTIFALCGIFTADCSMYLYSDGTGKFGMTSIGYYLYRYNVALTQTSSGDHIYGYISAFGVFVTSITIPLVIGGRKLLEKIQDNVEF